MTEWSFWFRIYLKQQIVSGRVEDFRQSIKAALRAWFGNDAGIASMVVELVLDNEGNGRRSLVGEEAYRVSVTVRSNSNDDAERAMDVLRDPSTNVQINDAVETELTRQGLDDAFDGDLSMSEPSDPQLSASNAGSDSSSDNSSMAIGVVGAGIAVILVVVVAFMVVRKLRAKKNKGHDYLDDVDLDYLDESTDKHTKSTTDTMDEVSVEPKLFSL